MSDVIEAKAELSVGRACAFGGIAIGTFMIGSISEPADALRTGGVMTLLTAFILMLKANLALQKPYKRTEVWLLLAPAERPGPAIAQVVIGRTLHVVFLRFALYASVLSVALLLSSLVFRLLPRSL